MIIKTLSPLHIGNGEQYNAINWYWEKSILYIIDIQKLIRLMGKDLSIKFGEWIVEKSNKIYELEKLKKIKKREKKEINRKIRNIHKGFNLYNFLRKQQLNISKFKSECTLYTLNCNNIPYSGNDIYAFIKQMNRVYIPATEIKGAIRTAILYKSIMQNNSIQDFLKNSLQGMLKESVKIHHKEYTYKQLIDEVKNRKKFNREFKKRLRSYIQKINSSLQELVFRRHKKDDAQYDILKFLQIGDSVLQEPTEVLTISYAEPFNISNNFRVYYEYMIPDIDIPLTEFRLSIEESKKEHLKKIDLKNKQDELIKDIKGILRSCYDFTEDLLEEEINFFKKHKQRDALDQLIQIQQKNNPESPVIRIGKDEGFLSLTIGLAVKRLWPDIYENILIHTTKNVSYDSKHGGPLPKSRKLVKWNGKKLTSGWIQLIPEDIRNSQNNKNTNSNLKISIRQNLSKKFRITESKK